VRAVGRRGAQVAAADSAAGAEANPNAQRVITLGTAATAPFAPEMASPAPETAPAGDAAAAADVTVSLKWNGAALQVSLPPTADVAGLKRALEERTSVLAKKQRLLGLKTRAGSAATDATRLSELAVAKPIMLMGTAEAAHAAVTAMEVAPHVQGLADDLDDDLDGAATAAAAARDEVEARLRRRVGAAVIRENQPPRPGHKVSGQPDP
jgi:hypothetical protein